MENKLLLIDGNSILNRAFYGLPEMTNSQGLHTNAILGFLNIMFKFLEEEHVAVVPGTCFGEGGEGFVRCCYATDINKIKIAMERIAQLVKEKQALQKNKY